jgi:hypothetical protein
VISHKEFNNKRKLDAYQYETYNKVEFDLNRIPKEMREKKLFKPIQFVFDNVDSLNSGEKPSLPNIDLIQSFTYERVWFVVNDDSLQIFNGKDQYDQIVVALQNNYHLESQQEFNGITELLFERNHG